MLFDKVFSAYAGPADAREPWPCAEQHQPGDGPFTNWATTVHSLLRYHHQLSASSNTTERRGRKINPSCLVVWGPQILRSVMVELATAHGKKDKGRRIDVNWGLEHLRVLDLQAADLFWHEANEDGVGYLAHLDATSPAEECALIIDHAQYLTKNPYVQLQGRPLQRRPEFRHGPAGSTMMPTAPGLGARLAKESSTTVQRPGSAERNGGVLPQQQDSRKRKAVELHAEDLAVAHYQQQGWQVLERGRPGKPYDLRCVRGDEVKHVEVKGLSGAPVNVTLTANEKQHSQDFPNIDLFVVHGIRVSSTYEASEGASRVYEDWTPQEEDLTPAAYQYRLPST